MVAPPRLFWVIVPLMGAVIVLVTAPMMLVLMALMVPMGFTGVMGAAEPCKFVPVLLRRMSPVSMLTSRP